MNKKIGILSSLLLLICCCMLFSCREEHGSGKDKDPIFIEIDKEISKAGQYDDEKEKRIDNIKKRIGAEDNAPQTQRELVNLLIDEYEAYISDSALYYINLNLSNPSVLENKKLENELLIRKADVAAHAGLFSDATLILSQINKQDLDSALLVNYYGAYCDLYQYLSEYATESEYAKRHEELRELYIDSVCQVASPSSINYIVYHTASMGRRGKFEEARKLLLDNIDKYSSGDRNYSILASILADVYHGMGDNENYKKYLSLSVISDIHGAVKENMAIRALATECYEGGDLERADRYLRKSFADANFYSARMRNAQSSRMLPIIGDAYDKKQKRMHHELTLLVVFMSILAFGFILISVFAFKQIRTVRAVNKKTKDMLDEVSNLSYRLTEVNEELSKTNTELQSSNKLKEEYAALFMEYCSLAISSLQKYQQSLKVAAAQGSMPILLKKIESLTFESKTLAEFYSKFDEAILNLYPSFVEKINNLLRPEERIVLKPKEGLNTELRVFALIRIGINDSEKIAKFLRCSLATVYTYRSRIKKKAIDPDNFEERLSQI